ncbi:MAG: hypothetical protein HW421_1893 [Ignavibacteria bacterium]|nr:hypothetical protein [Ignavibacteria bacterium]
MGIIKSNILLIGEKPDEVVETFLDSGATYSFIKKEISNKLGNLGKTTIALSFKTAETGWEMIVNDK